jgi:flagellar biogenesis protein FliO
MSIRRNRRSSLVLLMIISMCVGGFAVCYSAEGEPLPEAGALLEAPPADRPAPYYDDAETTAPEAEARAERSPLPRVKIFAKPAKAPPRPVVEESPTILEKVPVAGKTPLPKSGDSEPRENADTTDSTAPKTRTSYVSGVIWAMGILAAGVIIRQFLKSGGPLSNSSPGVVEVLSRQSLGPQQQLSVVRFGQRVLLVGTTSTGMTTLAQVEDPDEVQALLSELESSAANSGGSNPFRFRRAKNHSAQSRPDRSRWADPDRTSPAVSVSLSTESRTAAHERRPPSPPHHEVNDV